MSNGTNEKTKPISRAAFYEPESVNGERMILQFLQKNKDKAYNGSIISRTLNRAQPTVASHLRSLFKKKLVDMKEKDGAKYYILRVKRGAF